MKIHQSSLNLFSSSVAKKKTENITVSGSEKNKILPIHAAKNATQQADNKLENNTIFTTVEDERRYIQAVNLASSSQQNFEKNNFQLNTKSLKAISAYLNERNQPEQDKLASLMNGFDITV